VIDRAGTVRGVAQGKHMVEETMSLLQWM
jgi:hypothetical protein